MTAMDSFDRRQAGRHASLLTVRELKKHFPVGRGGLLGDKRRVVRAVDGVSLTIRPNETLALVGESGCGKSTTGRLILRLIEPTSGEVNFHGRDILEAPPAELRALRREMQMVFQDPYASLSPRLRVGEIIAEPIDVHGLARSPAERREMVERLLREVGLTPEHAGRYPFEFSGGQRQRIAIARALAVRPRLIVADEPVSALDVSIRSQVINLMQDLQEQHGIAYLFISHDLAVVRHIAHRVAVMYLGVLVEVAATERLFAAPHHPYTQALLSAVPVPEPAKPRRRIVLTGEVPSPSNVPPGCRFHTRCPIAQPICREVTPPDVTVAPGHVSACHFANPFPIDTTANTATSVLRAS
jgi:oligopeptide transport system ATP-binding protein